MSANETSETTNLPSERNQELITSAEEYMHGNISLNTYRQREHQFGTNYESAFLELATKQVYSFKLRTAWLAFLKRFTKRD